jgi:hypothetical protein
MYLGSRLVLNQGLFIEKAPGILTSETKDALAQKA